MIGGGLGCLGVLIGLIVCRCLLGGLGFAGGCCVSRMFVVCAAGVGLMRLIIGCLGRVVVVRARICFRFIVGVMRGSRLWRVLRVGVSWRG